MVLKFRNGYQGKIKFRTLPGKPEEARGVTIKPFVKIDLRNIKYGASKYPKSPSLVQALTSGPLYPKPTGHMCLGALQAPQS